MIVIDCRFDYEYSAGHIKGAININDQNVLVQTFVHDRERLRRLMRSRTILVFHCEFSEKRGPSMWTTLRNLDRNINMAKFPKLFYPEMYLLEKGYSAFHKEFPDLCEGTYKCQAGDKLEKSRYRSMQRSIKSYSVNDQVTQLRKSASTGHGSIPKVNLETRSGKPSRAKQ